MTKAKGAKYWDAPLNFMTGCTNELPCWARCWARSAHEARRKGLLAGAKLPEMYRKPFSEIQLFYDKLAKDIPGGKPKTYFVDNTGDLFHPDVDVEFQADVLKAIAAASHDHRFLLLTKRPKIMAESFEIIGRCKNRNEWFRPDTHEQVKWPIYNVWLGLTICNQPEADENVIHLLRTPAINRWLSIEPMLSEIDLESIQYQGDTNYFLNPLIKRYSTQPHVGECNSSPFMSGLSNFGGLDWIVIGCESGANRRPCKLDWVYSLVDQCQNAGVKYFIKQLDLDGKCVRDIKQFPKDLQTRDLPWEA